jgi:hypothetical protein
MWRQADSPGPARQQCTQAVVAEEVQIQSLPQRGDLTCDLRLMIVGCGRGSWNAGGCAHACPSFTPPRLWHERMGNAGESARPSPRYR